MRKLAAAGIFAASLLGVSLQAGAATTTYDIDGTFGSNEQSCTQIAFLFSGSDCTYGRNRPASSPAWIGHLFSGGHYNADGTKDQLNYVPTFGSSNPAGTGVPADFTPAADDGKVEATVTGQIVIDDNGTPGDATDDLISGAFSIGPMVRNLATGQVTRAVQGWTSMDHTFAAVAVNATATIANGNGGIDYVIGSRGFPTRLCYRNDAMDCFPTDNSMNDFGDLTFWAQPAAGSIGIERSGLMADPAFVNVQPPPATPTGNVGAVSTATFNGLTCIHSNGAADDCAVSPLVWGAGEPAGFDNMVMMISTNNLGAITSAFAYFSEEYVIGFGGPPAGYDNSTQSGAFQFTGLAQGLGPNAQDFAVSVLEGSTTNTLDTVTNSVNFAGPVTVSIITPPAQGTATVNGDETLNYDTTGAAPGPQTIVYEATDGTDTDQGTITITVAADALPVAPDGPITISTQGAAPGAGTAGSVNVATLAGYMAGNTPSAVTITTPPNAANGTATVSGTTITFTPAATFFAGSDTIGYTLTDNDSDTDTGTITVTIADLTPVLNDGAITTDQDTTSTALALGITPGNGSVAQHTLAVSTQATNGACNLSGTSVTYTPNAAYVGADSCVVTITDGDGESDTGTLTITVNEVSNDLQLPGGSSALDPWSLALLGALPLLRRRRRG